MTDRLVTHLKKFASLKKQAETNYWLMGEIIHIIKNSGVWLEASGNWQEFCPAHLDISDSTADTLLRLFQKMDRDEVLAYGIRKASILVTLEKKDRDEVERSYPPSASVSQIKQAVSEKQRQNIVDMPNQKFKKVWKLEHDINTLLTDTQTILSKLEEHEIEWDTNMALLDGYDGKDGILARKTDLSSKLREVGEHGNI